MPDNPPPPRYLPRGLTPEAVAELKRLYEKTDVPLTEVAAQFEICRHTLRKVAEAEGWTPRLERPGSGRGRRCRSARRAGFRSRRSTICGGATSRPKSRCSASPRTTTFIATRWSGWRCRRGGRAARIGRRATCRCCCRSIAKRPRRCSRPARSPRRAAAGVAAARGGHEGRGRHGGRGACARERGRDGACDRGISRNAGGPGVARSGAVVGAAAGARGRDPAAQGRKPARGHHARRPPRGRGRADRPHTGGADADAVQGPPASRSRTRAQRRR